jgi:hypothetical protein
VAQERETKTSSLIAALREVAGKGTRELLRRLDQEPESIQTRDLTVLTGVALQPRDPVAGAIDVTPGADGTG